MIVKRINNTSETITFNELLKGLAETDFSIHSKLAIKDVIGEKVLSKLDKAHKNLFNSSHFDFVVLSPEHIPVFAVEFDGPHHSLYEKKQLRDIRKNRICQIAEFPLIRVTDFELEKIDSISVLEFIAYRFAKYYLEIPRIKKALNKEIENMTDEQRVAMTEKGYLDPMYDPEYLFDFEFPFPLRDRIFSELKTYSLYDSYVPEGNTHLYWYSVSGGSNIPLPEKYTSIMYYGIYKGKSKTKSISWKDGKLESEGIEIIKEEKVQFSLKSPLRTTAKYDGKISPMEFYLVHGFMPVHFIEIPGVTESSIVEAIAEYLCYKKVLEWANLNLEKTSNI